MLIHPLHNAQDLEDVEGVEHLLHKEKVVWLHGNIYRIGAITEKPGEEEGHHRTIDTAKPLSLDINKKPASDLYDIIPCQYADMTSHHIPWNKGSVLSHVTEKD